MSHFRRRLMAVVAGLLVLGLATTGVDAGLYTVTVTAVPNGITERGIGACEGGFSFNVNDIVDIGMNTFRIWGSSAETEPVDDDGVYGSPSIAEIKANPNIIPWSVWDARFKDPNFRTHGTSLYDMLVALRGAGIAPLISLVNVNNNDQPAWMQQLNPPTTVADWNEWWEHVFAWVYYANVINDFGIDDWQVLNEPDNSSQGWGGTLQDYIIFTQYTHDAIQYVYDTYLPGRTFRLYAPVSTHPNEWITESLISNDPIIDIVDWHRYGPPAAEAEMVNAWVDQYDSDGVHEGLCISEWGSYRGAYDSHGDAMNYAKMLIDHSFTEAARVDRSTIFSLYDWSTRMIGLIAPDGTRRPPFYSMRLVTRGLQGGKQKYAITHNIPSNISITPIAAVDQAANVMYVELMNQAAQPHSISLDVSAHVASATVTLRQYASGINDVVIGTASLQSGLLTVDLPASSIMQVIIPLDGGAPPPTPVPAGEVHVQDIAMSFQKAGVNYKAVAVVTIVDAQDAPLEEATVSGTFSGATGDTVSGVTGAGGQVTLLSSTCKYGGTWTFCVDGIAKDGWSYDAAANVETCDSITAP